MSIDVETLQIMAREVVADFPSVRFLGVFLPEDGDAELKAEKVSGESGCVFVGAHRSEKDLPEMRQNFAGLCEILTFDERAKLGKVSVP